ncbi:SIMPL domain-containing protein [Methylomonas sp. AM2-LC]|uniref:SIMPL domain-containing protein n=1 Tax=Methylomonas sp. AM2-LC TaxID=3153301 RepID=UPI00326754AB
MPDAPFVYSQGEAKKEIKPNMVDLKFSIKTFDENPDKAFKLLQNENIELKKLFDEIKISDDSIEAFDIDKSTVRETNNDGQELKVLGYDIQQVFHIRLLDLDKYTALMNRLIKYRNIADFNSNFDVLERKEIESQLTAEACADAKHKAEVMANGVGSQLGSVFAMAEKRFFSIDEAFGFANEDDNSDRMMFKKSQFRKDSITYIPSVIKIEKKVNVIYKLSEK